MSDKYHMRSYWAVQLVSLGERLSSQKGFGSISGNFSRIHNSACPRVMLRNEGGQLMIFLQAPTLVDFLLPEGSLTLSATLVLVNAG